MATEAYCVKCKASREIKDAKKITMKNGARRPRAPARSAAPRSSRSAADATGIRDHAGRAGQWAGAPSVCLDGGLSRPPAGKIALTWRTSTERPILAVDLGGTQIRTTLVTSDRIGPLSPRDPRPRTRRESTRSSGRIVEVPGAGVPEIQKPPRRACRIRSASASRPPGPLDPWAGIVRLGPRTSPAGTTCRSPRPSPRGARPARLPQRRRHERGGHGRVALWRRAGARATRSTSLLLDPRHRRRRDHRRPAAGRTPDGTAGEVGHITVELDGPRCGVRWHRPRRGHRLGHRACTGRPGTE